MAVLARHGYYDREDGVNYYPTPESYTRRLERHGFKMRQIALIPRPTPLSESGMDRLAQDLSQRRARKPAGGDSRDQVLRRPRTLLAPALRDEEGNWTGDYVRLRFVATT
jgi:hypothetical protein